MNETHVTLVGTVIQDLRRRTTAEGAELISFRMASNERRFDRTSGEWVDGETLYANVTCWRRLVKGVAYALAKGDPVVVTGRLYTRSYEVEGQRRHTTELDAVTVGIDLSRCIASIDRTKKLPAGVAPPAAEEQIEQLEVSVPDTAEELTAEETVDA
jgi:single-strand DNA-binding protein